MKDNLSIFIPDPGTTSFSLYARCAVQSGTYSQEKQGTFLLTAGGIVILFYTYTFHHRRAYIISSYQPLCCDLRPTHLPAVRESLLILYCAQGRKIDYLRKALWYLFRIKGRTMFSLPISFWLSFSALNDMYDVKYRLPGSTLTNISVLLHKYDISRRTNI